MPTALNANIGGLRPNYTPKDLEDLLAKVKHLPPGSSVRFGSIFHEIFWFPTDAGNFRGLDEVLRICQERQLKPLVLIMAAPHHTSGWYNATLKPEGGWWLPNASLIPKIAEKVDVMVKHILVKCKALNIVPMFQLWNEPAGQARTIGPKPGGSSVSKYGEWSPTLHKLLYATAQVLRANKVPVSRIVSPAISTIADGNVQEVGELLSWRPPADANWLSMCGHQAFHLFFKAGWATDPATRLREVTNGFNGSMDYFKFFTKSLRLPKSRKVMITEFYVTPGMCGIRTVGGPKVELDHYRDIAHNLLTAAGIPSFVYGILNENDLPGQNWLDYGGWGEWLERKNATVPKVG